MADLDHCIHIANALYLGSYLCIDILWLRILTCAGLVFGITFFCSQTQAMFAPASWMGHFLVVNCIQVFRVVRERNDMRLSSDQEAIASLLLERLSRDDMLDVLARSVCRTDRRFWLISKGNRIALNNEEVAFRNVAFDRLSNQELVNLIVRRFWKTIQSQPKQWRSSRHAPIARDEDVQQLGR